MDRELSSEGQGSNPKDQNSTSSPEDQQSNRPDRNYVTSLESQRLEPNELQYDQVTTEVKVSQPTSDELVVFNNNTSHYFFYSLLEHVISEVIC